MSTFLYSDIVDGDSLAFDSESDVLRFDSADVSAADFTLTALPGGGVQWTNGGKTFTLEQTTLTSLSQVNVEFADGSLLVNSCIANGFATDLSGSSHDDLLLGSRTPASMDLISESNSGAKADLSCSTPSVSADGRFVVFSSDGTNLGDVADTNGIEDIFLKDLLTGEMTRVSTNDAGDQAVNNTRNGLGSSDPVLSEDGKSLIFDSWATNLVAGDSNRCQDVFVKNLQTGAVIRASESSTGAQANNSSFGATTSADGRYVAFTSAASNLIGGDSNGAFDVFVKDTVTGTLTLASSSSTGEQGNAGFEDFGSFAATISADGKFVAFQSYSTNLVSGDDNGASDIFVKNLQTGEIVCASTDVDGNFVAGSARDATLSADGRYVVFASSGTLMSDGQDGAGAIYRKDLQTGELSRVLGAGVVGGWPGSPSVSANGRFIVFTTYQALADSDKNQQYDVYVKDMLTGAVAHVSVGEAGQQSSYGSTFAHISEDGNTITFASDPELTGGQPSPSTQIYVVGNPLSGWTLRGGEGDDVYQITNAADHIVEAPGAGIDTVRSSASHVLADNVERLVLTGNSAIDGRGNALDNRISGNSAGNVISGGAGNDVMNGGAGSDTASYDDASSGVIVDLNLTSAQATGGAGSDTLISFENLRGSAHADHLTGTAAANVLDGGGGVDTLTGGNGNDTYVIDNRNDVVVERASGGTDLVRSTVSTTLGNELENLTLLGSSAINGAGNAKINVITGNDAANTLNGGAGADTLIGGEGGDTYLVDNTGDQVIETAPYGVDTVKSTVSWTLGTNLENLTLLGTGSVNGFGNSWDNTLTGNGGANLLNGGEGADTMVGGGGDDTYVVDNNGDTISESLGGGVDLIKSFISWSLGDQLEDLTLLGSGANDGYGNALANHLNGNGGDNRLDGHGGADTMAGGNGNDTYVIDAAGDVVIETAAGGYADRVEASVSWTMAANVEQLTLTGSTAINGTGNAQGNIIVGNAAANILNGGAGGDHLVGGGGNDTYVFDNYDDSAEELAGGGVDIVKSYVSVNLGSEIENLTLLGTSVIDGTGNAKDNVLTGNGQNNVLAGGAGIDTMTGGAGRDTFVVGSALGSDFVTDFQSLSDSVRVTTAVGDGDRVVEGAVAISGPGGFSSSAELVIVLQDIVGSINVNSAASAIGHADSAYAVGSTRLFVVDNGTDSAVYMFQSANNDAVISASELTLLTTLQGCASTSTLDFLFGP